MEAWIAEKLFVYENDESGIEQLFVDIDVFLEKSDSFLDAVIVDGTEVLENHEEYILSHINDIKRIDILLKSNKQFIRELHASIDEYVTRALPELDKLATEFYQGTTADTWGKVGQLMEALAWIHQTLQFIVWKAPSFKTVYSDFSLEEELSMFEQALKEKDYVLAGDIIQYDIITKIHKLQVASKNALDEEVNKNALS
ncbi:hypothetical protein [Brevibacillus borstelensis]|uniref:hypothetical protein n=1 Tax=Brevibacillus borstelensis TaxID=45462 RepID=UPI0030C5A0CC